MEQWFNWHQGYRIVKHENGFEEREPLQGEVLANVDVGHLPRTWDELRERPSASDFQTPHASESHGITDALEIASLAQQSDETVIPPEDRLFDDEPDSGSDSQQAIGIIQLFNRISSALERATCISHRSSHPTLSREPLNHPNASLNHSPAMDPPRSNLPGPQPPRTRRFTGSLTALQDQLAIQSDLRQIEQLAQRLCDHHQVNIHSGPLNLNQPQSDRLGEIVSANSPTLVAPTTRNLMSRALDLANQLGSLIDDLPISHHPVLAPSGNAVALLGDQRLSPDDTNTTDLVRPMVGTESPSTMDSSGLSTTAGANDSTALTGTVQPSGTDRQADFGSSISAENSSHHPSGMNRLVNVPATGTSITALSPENSDAGNEAMTSMALALSMISNGATLLSTSQGSFPTSEITTSGSGDISTGLISENSNQPVVNAESLARENHDTVRRIGATLQFLMFRLTDGINLRNMTVRAIPPTTGSILHRSSSEIRRELLRDDIETAQGLYDVARATLLASTSHLREIGRASLPGARSVLPGNPVVAETVNSRPLSAPSASADSDHSTLEERFTSRDSLPSSSETGPAANDATQDASPAPSVTSHAANDAPQDSSPASSATGPAANDATRDSSPTLSATIHATNDASLDHRPVTNEQLMTISEAARQRAMIHGQRESFERAGRQLRAAHDAVVRFTSDPNGRADHVLAELRVTEDMTVVERQVLESMQSLVSITWSMDSREEVERQGDNYVSPVGELFERAYERYRAAEATRNDNASTSAEVDDDTITAVAQPFPGNTHVLRHMRSAREQSRRAALGYTTGLRAEASDAGDIGDDEEEIPRGLDATDDGRPEALTEEQMMRNMQCSICYAQLATVACIPCGRAFTARSRHMLT